MPDAAATYTIDEAARILRCSRWTLRDQVTRGEVPHHRAGRVKGVYFTQADLDLILAAQARTPTPTSPRTGGAAGPAAKRPSGADIPAEFARLRKAGQRR